ncbi:hypothetical protein DWU99_15845 [Dyella psychrodurans]|uniref:Uncharacterized protein n=1 Tax=Dyella psychrodurans TaxID=1927960 RepID=A0A370X0S6_9GAMM|nr:hypothetical protein DWU99_15845 [Dyella psychrodurans]
MVDNTKVVPLTRFLEEQPLNKDAPLVRAALLDWEDKSTDVVDVVCPGMFSPVPDKSIKYSAELMAQFIFGSAAYQIANPSEKGKLMPAQLAGMKSMLKAYRSIIALEPNARISRFDELSKDEEQGNLPQVVEPLVVANCKSPADASTGGLPPWHFQMTPQEVASFSDYGPYDKFRNGDLETYSGLFNGHKENVQFYFEDGKLARIEISLYEGQDVKAAAKAWGQTYTVLKTQYGNLELHGIQINPSDDTPSPDVIAVASGAAVQAGGKVQLAPLKQPMDKFVFASFSSSTVQGDVFYYVEVFYDPPHG